MRRKLLVWTESLLVFQIRQWLHDSGRPDSRQHGHHRHPSFYISWIMIYSDSIFQLFKTIIKQWKHKTHMWPIKTPVAMKITEGQSVDIHQRTQIRINYGQTLLYIGQRYERLLGYLLMHHTLPHLLPVSCHHRHHRSCNWRLVLWWRLGWQFRRTVG